eukprot:gb/GECG01014394.1/.p1 GENE.gb/GECG01014394.1/~~gb/GECG01014394.1/.p1  ORF type:complete len:475 (+),score=81.58 gb/GECG01014394.1/:1-1425(+)
MPKRGASASAASAASSTRLRRLTGGSNGHPGSNDSRGQDYTASLSAKRKAEESQESSQVPSAPASAKRRRVASSQNGGGSGSGGTKKRANSNANKSAAATRDTGGESTAGSVAIGSTSAAKAKAASGRQQTSSKRSNHAKSSSKLETQSAMDRAAAAAVSDMEQSRRQKSESQSSVERRSSVEEMNLEDSENQIEDLLQNTSKGVTTEYLESHFDGPKHDMVKAINSLLGKHRLQLYRQDDTLLYKLVPKEDAEKYSGLTAEEMMVLQQIERSQDKGIWTRTLKTTTKLQQHQLNKVLKRLESRQLIKSVKSVAQKNKKMYMMYDIVPSKEVTGGPWYTEQELDHAFIEGIRQFVYKVLRRSASTRSELVEAISRAEVSQVKLGEQEVQQILDTLRYDGMIKKRPPRATGNIEFMEEIGEVPDDKAVYKVAQTPTSHEYVTEMPCGVCPVFNECVPGGDISPELCIYMDKWLDF